MTTENTTTEQIKMDETIKELLKGQGVTDEALEAVELYFSEIINNVADKVIEGINQNSEEEEAKKVSAEDVANFKKMSYNEKLDLKNTDPERYKLLMKS